MIMVTNTHSSSSYLHGRKAFVELKRLQRSEKRRIQVKSFFAAALLAASVALTILFSASTFLLGTGIGLIIISSLALQHYSHLYRERGGLFARAAHGINQLFSHSPR